MRIFLALICSFALASVALGAQQEKKKEQPKKKGAQASQISKPGGKKGAKPAEAGKSVGVGKPTTAGKPAQAGKPATRKGKLSSGVSNVQPNSGNVSGIPTGKGKGKGKHAKAGQAAGAGEATAGGKPPGGGKKAGAGKSAEAATAIEHATPRGKAKEAGIAVPGLKPTAKGKTTATGKPFKPQHFNLASKSKPATSVAPAVTFQQNRRIQGSQNWQGSNYQVFRNYRSEWHDRNWWHNNSSNVVFIFGGWYALNNGWWYPAWGYAPNSYYFYNGPIYAYNNLPPDQVIANVQAALQAQGYYRGEVDGLLGPLTREALANYQRDRGLYMTSAIDRPTLESLGMA